MCTTTHWDRPQTTRWLRNITANAFMTTGVCCMHNSRKQTSLWDMQLLSRVMVVVMVSLFVLAIWSVVFARGEQRNLAETNIFGRCGVELGDDFPHFSKNATSFYVTRASNLSLFTEELTYFMALPSSLSQVNSKLAVGTIRGRPRAQQWLKTNDNSWQYPDHHPRRNKSACLAVAQSARAQPVPVHKQRLHGYRDEFYVVTQRRALVHAAGIVAVSCGYFQCLEGCETVFRFIGRKWYDSCSSRLRRAGIPWELAASAASPLLRDTYSPLTNGSSGYTPLCRERSWERWSHVPRLFVVSSVWDNNYHHFLVDVLPRLIRHLPFLLSNPDVKLHLRGSAGHAKERAAMRSTRMQERVLSLLGLPLSRFLSGPVIADEVYVPRCTTCALPAKSLVDVRLVAKALTHAALNSGNSSPSPVFASLAGRTNSKPTTKKAAPAPRTIVLQVRDCVELRKCNWRLWTPTIALAMTSSLRLAFPHSHILVANDSAVAAADCLACELRAYHEADLLIGLHGAGMTNMMFMKPGAVVIEIAGEYDGRMMPLCGYYNSLAAVSSVHHFIYYYDWRGSEPLPVDDIAASAGTFFAQVGG